MNWHLEQATVAAGINREPDADQCTEWSFQAKIWWWKANRRVNISNFCPLPPTSSPATASLYPEPTPWLLLCPPSHFVPAHQSCCREGKRYSYEEGKIKCFLPRHPSFKQHLGHLSCSPTCRYTTAKHRTERAYGNRELLEPKKGSSQVWISELNCRAPHRRSLSEKKKPGSLTCHPVPYSQKVITSQLKSLAGKADNKLFNVNVHLCG